MYVLVSVFEYTYVQDQLHCRVNNRLIYYIKEEEDIILHINNSHRMWSCLVHRRQLWPAAWDGIFDEDPTHLSTFRTSRFHRVELAASSRGRWHLRSSCWLKIPSNTEKTKNAHFHLLSATTGSFFHEITFQLWRLKYCAWTLLWKIYNWGLSLPVIKWRKLIFRSASHYIGSVLKSDWRCLWK